MLDDTASRLSFLTRYRKALLGSLSVVLFFGAWQAIFLVVPFNPLFISKPSLVASGLVDLVTSGDLLRDIAVSAVPFLCGFSAAVVIGVPVGIVMGWRVRVGYALDPLMTVFYASPLVALAPLVVIFFGVGVGGKTLIIFLLSVFPFIFNAYAGVRAVDRLLINVVRSLGGSERDLYFKVIFPSVLPYIVAGARIAVGRALIGAVVAEFFLAISSECAINGSPHHASWTAEDVVLVSEQRVEDKAIVKGPSAPYFYRKFNTPEFLPLRVDEDFLTKNRCSFRVEFKKFDFALDNARIVHVVRMIDRNIFTSR